LSALLLGCGGGNAGTPVNAPTGEPKTEPTTAGAGGDLGAQVARGEALFADNCASCHGDKGEGSPGGPPLIGKEALPVDPPKTAKERNVKFTTAQDLFQWVKKEMPNDNPGSLKDDEYWDVLAFDLKANGVDLQGKKLDASSASAIKLH
jgi:S-disulfanyl-L-cysteine oxidoreductase SoxD